MCPWDTTELEVSPVSTVLFFTNLPKNWIYIGLVLITQEQWSQVEQDVKGASKKQL